VGLQQFRSSSPFMQSTMWSQIHDGGMQ